jgi:hypothetical protein
MGSFGLFSRRINAVNRKPPKLANFRLLGNSASSLYHHERVAVGMNFVLAVSEILTHPQHLLIGQGSSGK